MDERPHPGVSSSLSRAPAKGVPISMEKDKTLSLRTSRKEEATAVFPLEASLNEIYVRLLGAYGPQHWWPAEEPFEVMVGAILTQSTAWANVAIAIRNLRTADVLSPRAIRGLTEKELATLIRPSGYYTAKTRKLKAMVSWLEEHQDNLPAVFAESPEHLRRELLEIYGIGEETADSILLYAAGKAAFVIDAYTRRIIDRVGMRPESTGYADYQRLFTANLPADAAMFNEYHALFVEHGKRSCRKTPQCRECCLLDICAYGSSVIQERAASPRRPH